MFRTEVFRNVEKLPPKIEACIPEEKISHIYSCDAIGMKVCMLRLKSLWPAHYGLKSQI
jgi:hypothetical protein